MISHSTEETGCCDVTHQPAPTTISADDRCRVYCLAPDTVMDDIQIYIEMSFSSHLFMIPLLG